MLKKIIFLVVLILPLSNCSTLSEFNEKANELRIFQKLKGWNKLLNKKCNHNQIMQIHSVNQPYCVYNEDALAENTELGCNHYVYAHMLNPGYH